MMHPNTVKETIEAFTKLVDKLNSIEQDAKGSAKNGFPTQKDYPSDIITTAEKITLDCQDLRKQIQPFINGKEPITQTVIETMNARLNHLSLMTDISKNTIKTLHPLGGKIPTPIKILSVTLIFGLATIAWKAHTSPEDKITHEPEINTAEQPHLQNAPSPDK